MCDSTYNVHTAFGGLTLICERDLNHFGEHENLWDDPTHFWHWSPGGASGSPKKDGKLPSDMYVCQRCGVNTTWHYHGEPLEPDICHTCNYWLRMAKQDEDWRQGKGSMRPVVIEGPDGNPQHYCFDSDQPIANGGKSKAGLGFGGSQFKIVFSDKDSIFRDTEDGKETATTNNLWHQGYIPKQFQELFPVNARFFDWREGN